MSERSNRVPAGDRLWLPVVVVLAVAAAALVVYDAAPPAVANVVIFPYAASLVLGPSIVYPWLRRRGGSIGWAAAGALCVPVLWVVKECYRLSAVFSFWETVFYAVNPLSLGLFTWAALQMAACELLLQRLWRGRWEVVSGAGLICAAILLLAGAFAVVAREDGATIVFYAYIAMYRYLFGG